VPADDADQLWEINAAWWAEEFTEGADAEYSEQILPLAAEHLAGARRILDVGCGEGQIARLAAGLPGVERGGVALARSGAAGLPFPDAAFDAVIACLVFEHITAVDEALAEVGRVLVPGGRFVFMLNHPLLQTPGSGWIDDTILDEQYWRIGPYLVEDDSIEEVAKDVFIPFIHRPLSRYVNGLAAAGLFVTHMGEPVPPPGFIARAAEYRDAATIPRLLLLRAEKLAPPVGPAAPD
jgi:SAM-dependent methyltransferase